MRWLQSCQAEKRKENLILLQKKNMAENIVLDLNDDSDALVEFYESNLDFLTSCPVHSLSPSVLRRVAVKLHSTLYFDSDWLEYASEMGITDDMHLATIQESARVANELPLYVTMMSAVRRINGNLSNLVKALLKTKRLDVLLYLKPFIEELLNKVSSDETERCVADKEQLHFTWSENLDCSFGTNGESSNETTSSLSSFNTVNSDDVCTVELDPRVYEPKACRVDDLQKNFVSRKPSLELKLHSLGETECSLEGGSKQVMKCLPSAPPCERLSILIQHTEFDTEVAKQLSAKLKEEGFIVKTLFDLEMVLMMDSTGALSTVFQEVDFVVPVVSKTLLEQIHPQVYEKYLESADAMNNRTLYQLIMTEYRNNRCVNLRVRPVLVPEMNRRLLTENVILSYSLRLWNELPKLSRILRETKELIPRM